MSGMSTSSTTLLSSMLKPSPITPHELRNKSKKASVPVKARAVRGRLGRLAVFLALPLDVFYEVVGWLDPLDLLHVARTSKHLRSLLMSKDNSRLWKAARRNVPGLPDCPSVLSEPRYAAYIFDQYCFRCGIGRSVCVDYNHALRFCTSCSKHELTKFKPTYLRDFPENYRGEIMACCITSGEEFTRGYPTKFWEVEVLTLVARLRPLYLSHDRTAVKKVLDEHRAFAEAMYQQGTAVLKWQRARRKSTLEEKTAIAWEREERIKQKLSELGYSDADFPTDRLVWDLLIRQPRELTERIWQNLGPRLLCIIAEERREREQLMYAERLAQRTSEARPFYSALIDTSAYEDVRPFMPNLHDACRLPSLAALLAAEDARAPVSQTRFAAISHQLLAEAQQYVAQAKRDLAEMVWRVENTRDGRLCLPRMPLMDAAAIDALLARGTTLFVCKNCPVMETNTRDVTTCMSARVACAHWRECHPGLQWNYGWPYENFCVWRKGINVSPQRPPFVDAYRETASVREAMMEMGLKETALHEELDTLVRAGRLICMCGSPQLPPAADLDWAKLISHVQEEERRAFQRSFVLRGEIRMQTQTMIDHHLNGPSGPCLKLLSDGEEPEHKISNEDADDLVVEIVLREAFPSCKICGLGVQLQRPDLPLAASVDAIAHHMYNKHGQLLTRDLIEFTSNEL